MAFLNFQDHMQLEISNFKYYFPTIFIADHPNYMRTLVTMVNLNAC